MNYKKRYFLLISIGLGVAGQNAQAQFYGWVKPSFNYSSDGLNSFSRVNMSAPTSAANSNIDTGKSGDRSTFQVAQSRIGYIGKIKDSLRATIEMDFIDFSKASPTTATRPRLRKAFVVKDFKNKLKMIVGQDWDLFSSINPITFNFIGNYFNGGNTGFMRQQIKFVKESGANTFGFAIGQGGVNSLASDSELEEENEVSYSALYQRAFGNISAQVTGISSKKMDGDKNKNLWGTTVGLIVDIGALSLSSEAYYGEGLSKTGALSLPSSQFGKEYGAYATGKYKFGEASTGYLGYGFAKAQDAGDSTFDSDSSVYSNLGAQGNQVYRMGASCEDQDGLVYYVEATYFETDYGDNANATNTEVGIVAKF